MKNVTALVLLCAFLPACSGGGGDSTGPSGGPPRPDASRIHVAFDAGSAAITGSAGAVQGATTVRAENQVSEVTAETEAGSDGSFSLSISASFADRLELRAVGEDGEEGEGIELSAGGLAGGETALVSLPTGSGEFGLLFPDGDEEHLVVLESAGFYGDVVTVSLSTATRRQESRTLRPFAATTPAARVNPQAEAEVRRWDRIRGFLRANPEPALARVSPLALQGAPTVGSVEPFWVDDGEGNFAQQPATLRYVGTRSLVYVDQRIGPALLSDAQVRTAAMQFEPAIYNRDRELFGAETDVDGNGRVKILFTPTVNLQGEGVLGFFFALDLVSRAEFEFSNEAEVFYVMAPDPEAVYGWQTPPMDDLLLDIVPTILAHEFQHMIAMGRRLTTGLGPREVWLEEAWSHVAEWLNGHRAVDEFRVAAFADAPEAAPLISPQLTDAERGASFLFGMYLLDQHGEGILEASIEERGTAEDNVERITDGKWTELFHEWSLALARDGQSSNSAHDFANLDPREIFTRLKGQAPELFPHAYLNAIELDASGLAGEAYQLGSTASYFRVTSTEERNIAEVGVSGPRDALLGVGIARTR